MENVTQTQIQTHTENEAETEAEFLERVEWVVNKLNKITINNNDMLKLIANLKSQMSWKDYSRDHKALINYMLNYAEKQIANISNTLIEINTFLHKVYNKALSFSERLIAFDSIYYLLCNIASSADTINTIYDILCEQEKLCDENSKKAFEVYYTANQARDIIKKYLTKK
ncbi:MAG: hypothetical protein QXL51_06600 [Candidatus Aenigmatarchaeota archaeon]